MTERERLTSQIKDAMERCTHIMGKNKQLQQAQYHLAMAEMLAEDRHNEIIRGRSNG